MAIKVRVTHDPRWAWQVAFVPAEPVEFDTFVEACNWVRDEIGPTAENTVIMIDTTGD